ncbi:MAG: hypothetical protein ACREF3_18765, partial [Acetobacteraceae bacterium]
WYRPYAATEMKDVHYCFAFLLDPGTFHARSKRIVLPTDLKGMKVRPADGTIGAMVTMLGGTNVQASAPEAREVLDRGVADAITFPWRSLILFGIDKVTKHHMDLPLYSNTFVWVMNKAKYEAMSPAQKQVIDQHCTSEWAEKVATPWANWEHSGRELIAKEPGQDIYQLTPDQIAEWRKVGDQLRQRWAAKVPNADAAFAALKADLKKHDALAQ